MKHGFAVMDATLHVVEPPDLWERYTATPFCDRAPKLRRVRETGRGSYIAFEGQTFPTVPESAGQAAAS